MSGDLSGKAVAVVGLGYVGLPLAVALGRRMPTIGFDISEPKVASFRKRVDPTAQVDAASFAAAARLEFTADPARLGVADFIVVAVPTPVDSANKPDFGPLVAASSTVGRHMKPGAIVIYESTVYPGATEEVCVPVLERASGRRWKGGFHVGYSPERVNPGDKEHTLERVVKVVAGDDERTLEAVAALYSGVVAAGVHRVSSIRVAEAAKVIENTQRDLNIALMNELAIIFDRLGLDTTEVLRAAGTKWNFLPFRPGLVGGHCIGVDPYYLTHKAEMVGYHPQIILAGRRINDGMGEYIADKTVKLMARSGRSSTGASVNVLGITFKENLADLRNSRVPDIVRELQSLGVEAHVHDPIADRSEAMSEYGIELRSWDELRPSDALIIAVAHRQFASLSPKSIASKLKPNAWLVDVKACLDARAVRAGGLNLWQL